jgi:hypothetical protein
MRSQPATGSRSPHYRSAGHRLCSRVWRYLVEEVGAKGSAGIRVLYGAWYFWFGWRPVQTEYLSRCRSWNWWHTVEHQQWVTYRWASTIGDVPWGVNNWWRTVGRQQLVTYRGASAIGDIPWGVNNRWRTVGRQQLVTYRGASTIGNVPWGVNNCDIPWGVNNW